MNVGKINENASTESIEHDIINQSDAPLIYRSATLQDCESLSSLINSSFCGESSLQGWTTPESLIGGQKTDVQMLMNIINDHTNIILVFFDLTEKTLVGCVRLEHRPALKIAYLGMLTVGPNLQRKGYGKFIMSVAENYAVKEWNVENIELNVLVQRPELVAYYNRRGFVDTGRRRQFPMHGTSGRIPKRNDLEFCIMEKYVKKT
jgi:ribosomal protein S18 acetylase RimI-like enzyme